MLLSGRQNARPDSLGDVGIPAEIPCLIDPDRSRQPALEIAIINEMLTSGADASGPDRLADVVINARVPIFVNIYAADHDLQKLNEILIRHVNPQIAPHGLNVDRA